VEGMTKGGGRTCHEEYISNGRFGVID